MPAHLGLDQKKNEGGCDVVKYVMVQRECGSWRTMRAFARGQGLRLEKPARRAPKPAPAHLRARTGLALCATPPVPLWVSQGAPQTMRPVSPTPVQSWAAGSHRSPDPQTPPAALWSGTRAPLLGPGAPDTHNPPHPPTGGPQPHWRRTKVCHCT